MNFNTPWTQDRVDLLSKLWAEGLTCSDIAGKMNGGFSRNAIIGKIHRMGLSQPMVKKIKEPPREHKPRVRIISSNSHTSHQRVIETRESVDQIKLRCAEVVPRHLTLLELERDDCKYPYGDGPFTFCGTPQRPGSSYCPAHFRLTEGRVLTLTDAERQRRRQHFADIKKVQA